MKRGRQKGGQLLTQPVDDELGLVLSPRTQLEQRNALGERIDSHPEPKHLRVTTQSGASFIQLHSWQCELTEGSLMQELRMLSCSQQPPRDGRMPHAKHSLRRRDIPSFG